MASNRAPGRLHNFHTTKRQTLGSAGPAPAWRMNAANASGSSPVVGSKILLSNLPVDVSPDEVKDLFSRTVGSLQDSFLLYNSQGRSKGMAIVSFARTTDGTLARRKYNGKLVDGRHRLKVEIVHDSDIPEAATPASATAGQPSLLARLAPLANGGTNKTTLKMTQRVTPAATKIAPPKSAPVAPKKMLVPQIVAGADKRRQKKGPRRINKRPTVAELDQEMDDYNAAA